MNPDDIPDRDDEEWNGSDENGDSIMAVLASLKKMHFASMKSGRYDGACTLIFTFGIKRYDADGDTYEAPVSMMISPEDTVNLLTTCLDMIEDSEADWYDNEDELQ